MQAHKVPRTFITVKTSLKVLCRQICLHDIKSGMKAHFEVGCKVAHRGRSNLWDRQCRVLSISDFSTGYTEGNQMNHLLM